MEDAPVLRHPIRALHQFCRDPELRVAVATRGGRPMTAIELQRHYLCACRRFLDARPDAPDEAHEVLCLWSATLDALEASPESLVGTLDWTTKRFLLERTAAGADWAERKKIDIRYHELSDGGYFRILYRAGMVKSLVDRREVIRAMRSAPSGTPATSRGHFIREFADGDEPLAVNWRQIVIGQGRDAKVIRLDQSEQNPPSKSSLAV
jgi:proteasome accessory factor A